MLLPGVQRREDGGAGRDDSDVHRRPTVVTRAASVPHQRGRAVRMRVDPPR